MFSQPRARNRCTAAALAALAIGASLAHGTTRADQHIPDSSSIAHDGGAYRSTYQRRHEDSTLIRNATVLDGHGRRFDKLDVLIRDGRIEAVGPGINEERASRLIEAEGRWVTPGLIDPHSHNGTYSLPLSDDSFGDISELSTPIVADTWIEHAVNPQDPSFYRALTGGVTTLQILPGSAPLIGGRTVVVKPVRARTVFEMKFPDAPHGLKMACGENPKNYFGGKGAAPTSRQGEIAMLRNAFIDARVYLEKQHQDDPDGAPDKRDLGLSTLAGVLTGDIRVHLHCYRASDIAVMLAVAREFGFGIAAVHHAAEAYKIPDLLAEQDVCAAVWSDWWGFKMEARDGIRENAAFVDAAGACVMMHSDSPFVGQQLNIEAAKAMAAGNRAGVAIAPERAIAWLTANPARALGLDDRIGRIAPGYNADVVVWSGSPFSIYTHADQVFIDGALHYDRYHRDEQSFSDVDLYRRKDVSSDDD
ncbi:MAG: amidohydrolase family protein [Pseudomonadota bacterium]